MQLNSAGRIVALVVLAVFGVTLLSRRAADAIPRPFVALGNRIVTAAGEQRRPRSNAVCSSRRCHGIAVGTVRRPDPRIDPDGRRAQRRRARKRRSLLFAYALGGDRSLALASSSAARVFAALKRSLGAGEWVRRGLGVAVLAGGGCDRARAGTPGVLTRLSFSEHEPYSSRR